MMKIERIHQPAPYQPVERRERTGDRETVTDDAVTFDPDDQRSPQGEQKREDEGSNRPGTDSGPETDSTPGYPAYTPRKGPAAPAPGTIKIVV
jgi:hypothetical protein